MSDRVTHPATASVTETYLRDFHRRHTGATRTAFGHLAARSRQTEYESSYHALATLVPNSHERQSVLDLACGDGRLLRILCDRHPPRLRLAGIDISQHELDAARATLPSSVLLSQQRAQHLSFEDASIDWVLCHMAIMLMDDVEQVLGEVSRILRPGGRFAAIVGRTFLLGPANEIFADILRTVAKTDTPPLSFGDRRTRNEAGWAELLRAGFGELHFDDIDVHWRPTPDELWTSLTETYDVDQLPTGTKERLRHALLPALAPLCHRDGTIHTGWGLRRVLARNV